MRRIIVTGANRGIGLAITREYLENSTAQVFATARNPQNATDLHQLQGAYGDRLHLIPLDQTDEASVNAAADVVRERTDAMDVLINNAGMNMPGAEQKLDTLDIDALLHVMRVNVGGPLLVTRALRPLLAAGENAAIVNISSQMGSMQWMTRGGNYAYSPSKAALNMVTRSMAADLNADGITTVTVHPGWVQTDMGGPSASLTPVESARGIVALTARLTPAHNGQFFRWDGTEHPW